MSSAVRAASTVLRRVKPQASSASASSSSIPSRQQPQASLLSRAASSPSSRVKPVAVAARKQGLRTEAAQMPPTFFNPQEELLHGWLRSIGLSDYFNTFVEKGFDDPMSFVGLSESDITKLGVKALGHKKKLQFYANCLTKVVNERIETAPSSALLEPWRLLDLSSEVSTPSSASPFASSSSVSSAPSPSASTLPAFLAQSMTPVLPSSESQLRGFSDDYYWPQQETIQQEGGRFRYSQISGRALEIIRSYEGQYEAVDPSHEHLHDKIDKARSHDIDEFQDVYSENGVQMWTGMPVEDALRLVELGALDLDNRSQEHAPSVRELLQIGREFAHHGISFHGYRVLPPREDEHCSIEGFHIPNMDSLSEAEMERLRSLHADEFYEFPKNSKVLRVWWT